MRRISALMLTVLLTCPPIVLGQRDIDSSQAKQLARREKRPDLSWDYAEVARFKLASRKTTYRLGEMITLDLAILNVAACPVYFHDLGDPALQFTDEQGRVESVIPYLGALTIATPDSYQLLKPNHMTNSSVGLHAGCVETSADHLGEVEDRDDRRIFEKNLFVSYGRVCLNVKQPGTYTIKARAHGGFVVVSPGEPNIKTATGVIISEPLTIKIIE